MATQKHMNSCCNTPKPQFGQQILHLFFFLTLLSLLLPQFIMGATITDNNKPIKIGAIFSETGIAAPHNKPLIEMTNWPSEHINDNGGVLGRPLELVLFDNLSTPIGSAQAARRCVLQDVTAVIGAHWSSHSLAIAPILQKAGIPMISPGSTNPDVTKDRDYIFRTCFLDSFQGVAMAKFARDEFHAKSAVVLTNIDENLQHHARPVFQQCF